MQRMQATALRPGSAPAGGSGLMASSSMSSSTSSNYCRTRSSQRPAIRRRCCETTRYGKISMATGDLGFAHTATTTADPHHARHRQQAEVAKTLENHPFISKVLVISSKQEVHTLHPLPGDTLTSYHKRVLERCGQDKDLAESMVLRLVGDVAACLVTALQHLEKHDVIHGCLNLDAVTVTKDPETNFIIARLGNFGASRMGGTALCPQARDLATVPPELCTVRSLTSSEYITNASATHDIWGMGTTLLSLLCATGVPDILRASSYGVKGSFTDPLNYIALVRAAAHPRPIFNLSRWVEAHCPPGTVDLLRGDVLDFISRCLKPVSERWSVDEAAQHPLIRWRMGELQKMSARLKQQQEAEAAALIPLGITMAKKLQKLAAMPAPTRAAYSTSPAEADPTASDPICSWLVNPGVPESSCGCPQPLPPLLGMPSYLCTHGAFTFTERLVHNGHELYAAKQQMVVTARHLPLHPAIEMVAASSRPAGKYLHLRLPAPTSIGLWEYVEILQKRHAGDPREYRRQLNKTAQAVLACGVTALQQLQKHDVVHTAITMQSFCLVEEGDNGPVFQLADFDCSRVAGFALCPGAVDLAAVPPELVKHLTDPYTYTAAAHPIYHDVWGLGMTILELYSPFPLVPLCGKAYGLEGNLAAPHNRAALELAKEELQFLDIIDWIEGYDPHALEAMPGDCRKLVERCLEYSPLNRWTPSQMAKSPFLLATLSKLQPVYDRIGQAQRRLHAAMDADQSVGLMLARQPSSPTSMVYLRRSCPCLGHHKAAHPGTSTGTPLVNANSPVDNASGLEASSGGSSPKAVLVSNPLIDLKKSPRAGGASQKPSSERLQLAVGGAPAGCGAAGVSSSGSSPVSGVPTPALVGDTGALQRQGSGSSSGGVGPMSPGAAPSCSVGVLVAALLSVAVVLDGDVDHCHARLAATVKSTRALVAKCHRKTGAMPRPMLLVACAPTLVCTQVAAPVVVPQVQQVAGGGGSLVGKAGGLLRAACKACCFWRRR